MRNTEISRILAEAQRVPWSILPEKLAEIRAFLYLRTQGVEISAEEREVLINKAETRQRPRMSGSVAVLPIAGTISHKMNLMSAMSGGVSTELLERDIRAAVADPDVSAILLEVDSPGGTVTGLSELHSAIMSARDQKPVWASINPLSASAAYWITSAASEISITESGQVGSVGVFSMHVDESAALEQEGLKVSLIHFGDRKVDGNPFQPLSEGAREKIQADVDAYGKLFHRDLARGRGISTKDVQEKFGGGSMFLAKEALASGLVDRIESRDQTLARLSRGGKATTTKRAEDSSPQPSADDVKRRLDLLNV